MGPPGRRRPIPSWNLQPSGAESFRGIHSTVSGNSSPSSQIGIPPPPRRPRARGDPLGLRLANFANFSPGASAEQKLGGHRRPPHPQPPGGPKPGGLRRVPTPAAAAQPTPEPQSAPARAAPPPARRPQHLPRRRGPRSLACWGRGLGGDAPPSPWEPLPTAPARRVPGRSAAGPTRARSGSRGLRTVRRVRGRECAQDTPPGSAGTAESRTCGARLGILFLVPTRIPWAMPRLRPGFPDNRHRPAAEPAPPRA